MPDAPSVAAALRENQRTVSGQASNLRDAILADYGYDIGQGNALSYYPGPQPAVRAAGTHYSAPGAREAYVKEGIEPVVWQSNPFATAAFRTYIDPYGQMSVQPLVGFPSVYPHVLSGVPRNPFAVANGMTAPLDNLLLQYALLRQLIGGGMPQQPARAGGGVRAGGGGKKASATTSQPVTTSASPVAAQAIPFIGPPPPEVRYAGSTAPLIPSAQPVEPAAPAALTPLFPNAVPIPEHDDVNIDPETYIDIGEGTSWFPKLSEVVGPPGFTPQGLSLLNPDLVVR